MAGGGVKHAELLKDLRKQVGTLEEDLRERSETVPEYAKRLRDEYDEAVAAHRTGKQYGEWRDERVTQVSVAWVLGTVFVRFCEDNELIAEPSIAGPGDRLALAEARHSAHFRAHPEQNDRDWLIKSIRDLADAHDTVAGLFDERYNPIWELEPSYEAASGLLAFWRRRGPDAEIVFDFTDPTWDTRFLGDLYQDLSESARKTYALLQTPVFVEEFILDLTLEPAVEDFGLAPEWRYRPSKWDGPDGEMPSGLRTIDPACGSGHFLLGMFHRLLAKWKAEESGTPTSTLIRRALESVHGCDKNPFAVSIARFRLLLAALKEAGETRLDRAPNFPINIVVGDSLLHGRGARQADPELNKSGRPFTYRTEDVYDLSERCDLLGVNSYHVVVGNPPYITVKDKQEKENYRAYRTASGQFSLSAPFAQRIFELAVRPGGIDRHRAGFTGQITANSFMKREFGKRLVEEFFYVQVDLTHVIDTSGAYIPGHGTPTVILAGRNRIALKDATIRAVLSVRGEPAQPAVAAEGLVWSAIQEQAGRPGSESNWISVEDLARSNLRNHPWSLSGGGAGDLIQAIEDSASRRLGSEVALIGRTTHTGSDDAYFAPTGVLRRYGLCDSSIIPLVEGEVIRDWKLTPDTEAIFPYNDKLEADLASMNLARLLWPNRSILRARREPGGTHEEIGLTWFEWSRWHPERFSVPLGLAFSFVATHNHFVLDRGEKVFNRSAPVIKLPKGATEGDHLALLGLLSSSTGCFWLKQVSHDKGSQSGTGGFMHDEWERFYEFTGTKLEQFPLPPEVSIKIASTLDELAREYGQREPESYFASSGLSPHSLTSIRKQQDRVRERMVAVQEELDWTVYGSYGLLSESEVAEVTVSDLDAVPSVRLGERAFEIALARKVAAGEAETVWFERHGSTPVTEIPERWPEAYKQVVQRRIETIEKRRDIALIERPECKRRWATEPWEKREKAALETWLQDRCEREDLWFQQRDGFRQPRTLTVGRLADLLVGDADLQSVAALYAADHLGKPDLPLVKVLTEVLKTQHVPYLAALRYKDSGLRKRADWEHVWELQREEDRTGKRLDIKVPPKYTSADFRQQSYWSHRGKLDVPKERFVSYPGASPDEDDSLLLGWAGWDHKDQAQALVNLVNDRSGQGWGTDRLRPLLAGVLELLPWVAQWHGDHDPDWGGIPAEEVRTFLAGRLRTHELSEDDLRGWRPEPARRGRRKTS